jgi:hypothetical protein
MVSWFSISLEFDEDIVRVWRREWKYDEKSVKWAQIIEDIYRMMDKIWIF